MQGTSSFSYLGSEASLIFTLFNLKNLPLVVETLSLDYKKNPITAKNSKYFLNLLNGTNILQNSPHGRKILQNLPNGSKILDGVAHPTPPANTSMSVLAPILRGTPARGEFRLFRGGIGSYHQRQKMKNILFFWIINWHLMIPANPYMHRPIDIGGRGHCLLIILRGCILQCSKLHCAIIS